MKHQKTESVKFCKQLSTNNNLRDTSNNLVLFTFFIDCMWALPTQFVLPNQIPFASSGYVWEMCIKNVLDTFLTKL